MHSFQGPVAANGSARTSFSKHLPEAFDREPRGALSGSIAAATIDHHEGIGIFEHPEIVFVDLAAATNRRGGTIVQNRSRSVSMT
jgi:hypothetical protein